MPVVSSSATRTINQRSPSGFRESITLAGGRRRRPLDRQCRVRARSQPVVGGVGRGATTVYSTVVTSQPLRRMDQKYFVPDRRSSPQRPFAGGAWWARPRTTLTDRLQTRACQKGRRLTGEPLSPNRGRRRCWRTNLTRRRGRIHSCPPRISRSYARPGRRNCLSEKWRRPLTSVWPVRRRWRRRRRRRGRRR